MIKKIIDIFKKPTLKVVENNSAKDLEKELILSKIQALEEKHQELINAQNKQLSDEDYTLTEKQRIFALSLVEKLNRNYILGIDSSKLTVKDLNRLVAYSKYRNKGALVNLEKKGVLIRK
ncbi:ABC transporter ATP-binding protein [Robertmurraya beringensis]|uniref:ABC transporter ATP-binding protein n=1 Tax=Robertmurraya beringensis TaxID=641660 RepID=A0ABV6KQ75_9BACI